jgi:hypothetical protein
LWLERLVRLFEIVALLRNCIIEKHYKISDELNAAVVLSDAGKKVRDQMVTKESVPPKEANLLTLLATVHVEPLVDIDRIDLQKLTAAISKEVASGALKYPLIFGRGALRQGCGAVRRGTQVPQARRHSKVIAP